MANNNQRYYPQNGYNMDYITAARAFNNPWQALGALIGNILVKNYENRGEEKLAKSLESSIPTQTAPTDAQVTQQMLQNNTQPREEQVQQNIFEKYQNANPIQMQNPYSIGLEALKNQTTDPLETAALQGAIDKAKGTTPQVTPNEQNAFQDYLRNDVPHMDASGNVSNMDAAANLQAQRQQATTQAGQNNIRPFSVEDWEAQVWAEGRKQGRPDYQIQAVIDRMKPQAESAERKYNDKMTERYLNQYYNNLPNADGTGGDPAMRLDAQIGLYKYNPDAAKILAAGGAGSIRDGISMNNSRERAKQQYTYNMQKNGKSDGSYTVNGIKTPKEIQEATERIKYAMAVGAMTEEEGKQALSRITLNMVNNIGKTSAQLKAEEKIAPFKQELTQKINTLRNGVLDSFKTGDVEATGNTLDEISQFLEQNPDAWKSLNQSERDQIEAQRYYANGMRQLATGDIVGAKKFFSAIPSYIAEQNQWDFSDDALDEWATHFDSLKKGGLTQSIKDNSSLELIPGIGIPLAISGVAKDMYNNQK